jgi:hypothetical protein
MKTSVSGVMRRKSPEEWAQIFARVHSTGRTANTLAKALGKRYAHRWQFIDFLGPNGRESAGVVDILAIRKSGTTPDTFGLKALDLFDIILIQVKGGSARGPTEEDIARLRLVQARYDAKDVVLFEWRKKDRVAEFSRLGVDGSWIATSAATLFGKVAKQSPTSTLAKTAPQASVRSLAAKQAWLTRKRVPK